MAFVQGSNGPDSLLGTDSADIIWGLGDNDTITGGGGNDEIDAGGGIDTIVMAGNSDEYAYEMQVNPFTWRNEGNYEVHFILDTYDNAFGRDGDDQLEDIEYLDFANGIVRWHDVPVNYSVLPGTPASEVVDIFGGIMDDTMSGHDGPNGFIGGLGNDLIDGHGDFDTVAYYALNTYVTMLPVAGGVTVDLAAGIAMGAWGTDTLTSIEGAAGSLYDDYLFGSNSANWLDGISGNDTLYGGNGDDTLEGGGGLDWALFDGFAQDYTLQEVWDNEWSITDDVGSSGQDWLLNVDRVQFDDMGLAFDLDGNAGAAARLIGVLLGGDFVRDVSIERIVIEALDAGSSAESFAAFAIDYLYPTLTNEQLASLMFVNVVGAQPSQSMLNDLVSLMTVHSDAWLAVCGGDTIYNEQNIDLAGLALTGVPFAPLI